MATGLQQRTVQALREGHQRLIAENPVTITVLRTRKVPQDGGFDQVESTGGPYTCRIVLQSTGVPNRVEHLAGIMELDRRWMLLAPHDADLQAGPHVEDRFTVNGETWRIKAVYRRTVHGEVASQECELERVG